MSSNENPHAGVDATNVAASPAAMILFFFMSVFCLSCEGSYTRRGASPGFRLRASSASFAGPPGPTGQRRFVSGYSCATAPDFHGIPFSLSQKLLCFNGARDGVRSRNPQIHNLMLYQLSYSRHRKNGVYYTESPPVFQPRFSVFCKVP